MSTPHDDIPPSQHAAIDRVLRAMAENLEQPHTHFSRCALLGVCHGCQPPCVGCATPTRAEATDATDTTPTPPPGEWLRGQGAIVFAATVAAAVTAIAVLIARHLSIG